MSTEAEQQPGQDAKNAMDAQPPHAAAADAQGSPEGSGAVTDQPGPAAGDATGTPDAPSPAAPPRKRRHALLWMLLAVFLACAAAALYAWQDARHFLESAPSSSGKPLVIDIRQGMTLQQIAAMLQKEGVVTDALRFSLLSRWKDKGRSLQKGRFLVRTDWQPGKVLDMLATGKAMLYRLTLREGMAWWEVADLLEKEGFCKASEFTTV
ncbi:MAG: endolytic transglycosylase MltG, partial [Mailhella sp.]|nr:endolytic transglycosylase MltG [Mailhella sp.]